jgi:hypothetical protein
LYDPNLVDLDACIGSSSSLVEVDRTTMSSIIAYKSAEGDYLTGITILFSDGTEALLHKPDFDGNIIPFGDAQSAVDFTSEISTQIIGGLVGARNGCIYSFDLIIPECYLDTT